MQPLVLSVCLTATLLTVTWGASLPIRQRRSLPGTSWSDWTPCTAQCDQGFQGRHNCGPGYQMPDLTDPNTVPPPPSPNCVHYISTCNLQPCIDKFEWQEFEPCNKPCGGGQRKRLTAPGCPVCPANFRFKQNITCHAQSCDKVPGCGKADIMYVLDSSGSVGDYNWFIEKQFAIDVIKALDIGNDETRVGMVTYSTEIELNFDFEEHDTIGDLESAIWGIPWMAGSTNTADGIRKARQVFQNARSDVKKIMVVVTDGNSNILNETTIPQAEEAKKEGITIFVIGIGSTINNEELEGIGSTPADKYVYHVKDFDALSLITQTIVEGTCEPVVDCGSYGAWDQCSKTCGSGIEKRGRACTKSVDGVVTERWTDYENRSCAEDPCPVTECGSWTPEGACTASCGSGTQKVTRVCTTRVGQTVTATETETDYRICNPHRCPVKTCNGWEMMTSCSVTCGDGTATYKRTCRTVYGDGAADKVEDETRTGSCNPDPCPRTVCGDWSPEGACTASCGGGNQKYTRVCTTYVGQTVTATETETDYMLCNTFTCPPVRKCGDWRVTVSCSVPCGDGEATYERTCRTVYGDGAADKVEEETETEPCNLGPCQPANDCSQCLYSRGAIDYLPVDSDPCSYYVCLRRPVHGGGYEYEMTLKACGRGTIWDQSILTCNHDLQGVCKGGQPVVPTGPVNNGPCPLKTVPGDNKVYMNGGQRMPCAAGTVFSLSECGCVTGDNTVPTCDGPLLYFPFDDHFNSVGCETISAYQKGSSDVTLAWDSKTGKSANFDGRGVLGVPFMANFFAERNLQGFTVALWFKWTGATSKIGGLVNNGDCEEGHSFELHVGNTGSVASGSLVTDGVGPKASGAYSVGRWDWTHIAEVYDGTSLKLYINGEEKSSVPMTGPISNRHCQMLIGQLGRDEGTGLFKGFMDELLIDVRAYDAKEISDLAK